MDTTVVGTDPLEALASRIRAREATVAVIGLGYVGLPLLVGADRAGFPVVGFDTDEGKIASLLEGRSYIGDVSGTELAGLGRSEFGSDPAILSDADVLLIAVPTPLTDHTPDLTMVRSATESVAAHLAPGRLVVLESTTYPGTTEELVRPILESTGLMAGRDFALAYSPERINPGQQVHRLDNTPKVVAGLTERCLELATSLYSRLTREVVTVSGLREAEMAKLIENTFRQVNIALVNELAILAHELEVDIWEALHAAGTKPFGYVPFWPGPGVGGHCISIDPSYLSWRAGQRLGYRLGFIEHANEVNNRMPDYVVARLGEALNEAGRPIKGSRILAIGVTYKPGIEDLRESPALAVLDRLARKGAEVSFHDPFAEAVTLGDRTIRSVALDEETISAQDCVIVLTGHRSIDYRMVARSASLVFDARGVTMDIKDANVIRL